MSDVVRAAIMATPINRLAKYTETTGLELDAILSATWEERRPECYRASSVTAPAKVITLATLPFDQMLRVVDSHREPGKIELAVDRATLPFDCVAVGVEVTLKTNSQGQTILGSLHVGMLGDPTALHVGDASVVALPAEAALRLGFEYAKIAG